MNIYIKSRLRSRCSDGLSQVAVHGLTLHEKHSMTLAVSINSMFVIFMLSICYRQLKILAMFGRPINQFLIESELYKLVAH